MAQPSLPYVLWLSTFISVFINVAAMIPAEGGLRKTQSFVSSMHHEDHQAQDPYKAALPGTPYDNVHQPVRERMGPPAAGFDYHIHRIQRMDKEYQKHIDRELQRVWNDGDFVQATDHAKNKMLDKSLLTGHAAKKMQQNKEWHATKQEMEEEEAARKAGEMAHDQPSRFTEAQHKRKQQEERWIRMPQYQRNRMFKQANWARENLKDAPTEEGKMFKHKWEQQQYRKEQREHYRQQAGL